MYLFDCTLIEIIRVCDLAPLLVRCCVLVKVATLVAEEGFR